jgi:hypothetical protein
MPNCSLEYCKCKAENGHAVHSLPDNRKKEWELVIEKNSLKLTPNLKRIYICECHFDSNQYSNREIKKLKSDAMPLIFKEARNSEKKSNLEKLNQELEYKNSKIEKLKLKLKEFDKLKSEFEELTYSLSKFLTPNQIQYLKSKNKQNFEFSDETVRNSLAFLHKSGHNCYEFIRKQGYPWPCYRTLMYRIENLNLIPGIQTELLEISSKCSPNEIIHCSLQIDEMQIRPSITYDKALKVYSGYISKEFKNEINDSVATHLLAYMMRSLFSDHKLVVAYYFTGNSINGQSLWEVTQKVIESIEKNNNFRIHSIVTDMGPSNRSMWKCANIISNRLSINCFTKHPVELERSLFFIADPTHLIKNLRNLLLKNDIILPNFFTEKFNLKSNIVSFDCVRFLVAYQDENSLKIQNKLSSINVNPTQYQKMRVNLAANIFDSETVGALKFIKNHYQTPNEMLSTAEFFRVVSKWFGIISCKKPEDSLNENSENFASNFEFLKMFITLIKSLKFRKDDTWKPIQTGFILTTESIINIFKYFSNKYGLNEIIPRRLTTDTVENLFSQIRSNGQAHPNSVDVRYALRKISFANHIDISKDSNYSCDESRFFTELETFKEFKDRKNFNTIEFSEEFNSDHINFCEELDYDTKNILYYLAGWIQLKLQKRLKNCAKCSTFLNQNHLNVVSNDANLTSLKQKFHASPAIVSILDVCEKNFLYLKNQKNFSELDCDLDLVLFNMCLKSIECVPFEDFPDCEHLIRAILKKFINIRIYSHEKQLNKSNSSVLQFESKSAKRSSLIK